MPVHEGQHVLARDIRGELLERRAVTGVVEQHGAQYVWVCKEKEWVEAHNEEREPLSFPWPAEDVLTLGGEPAVAA